MLSGTLAEERFTTPRRPPRALRQPRAAGGRPLGHRPDGAAPPRSDERPRRSRSTSTGRRCARWASGTRPVCISIMPSAFDVGEEVLARATRVPADTDALASSALAAGRAPHDATPGRPHGSRIRSTGRSLRARALGRRRDTIRQRSDAAARDVGRHRRRDAGIQPDSGARRRSRCSNGRGRRAISTGTVALPARRRAADERVLAVKAAERRGVRRPERRGRRAPRRPRRRRARRRRRCAAARRARARHPAEDPEDAGRRGHGGRASRGRRSGSRSDCRPGRRRRPPPGTPRRARAGTRTARRAAGRSARPSAIATGMPRIHPRRERPGRSCRGVGSASSHGETSASATASTGGRSEPVRRISSRTLWSRRPREVRARCGLAEEKERRRAGREPERRRRRARSRRERPRLSGLGRPEREERERRAGRPGRQVDVGAESRRRLRRPAASGRLRRRRADEQGERREIHDRREQDHVERPARRGSGASAGRRARAPRASRRPPGAARGRAAPRSRARRRPRAAEGRRTPRTVVPPSARAAR